MRAARCGVGDDAVDADGHESQADDREKRHQDEAELRAGVGLLVNEIVHRAGVAERDAAIDGPDFAPHRIHHRHGVVGGAHENAALAGAGQRVGKPDFGLDWFLQAFVANVADDADDFKPRIGDSVGEIGEVGDADAAADRIHTVEITLRESFVDDGDFTGIGDFGFVEEAAVAELNF